jgi:endonuclease/exonuclease/phosphatase family metal-dependent hydrolase
MVRLVALLVVVALGVSAATTPTTAATVATVDGGSLDVATFNIWGNVGHGGDADWVAGAVDEVLRPVPAVLALQEACRNQAEEFARRLRMRVEFLTLMPGRCDNGADFGNAVVFQGQEAAPVVRRSLPGLDDGEPRGVLCVTLRAVTFCSVHLALDSGRRLKQTRQLAAMRLGPGPVLLAGDFNAEPMDHELDPLYGIPDAREALGPRGRFTQPTHDDGSKIDYVFAWGGAGTFEYTNTRPSVYSDHYLYATRFTF